MELDHRPPHKCVFPVGQHQQGQQSCRVRGQCWASHAKDTWERKPFLLLHRMCLKSQLVDLKAEGYWEELLDTVRPEIVVKDW